MKVVKNDSEPKHDMNAKRPETTYSPEYIKDRARIDQLAKTIQNQILQLNKQLDVIQIVDFGFKLTEPGEHKKLLSNRKRYWMGLIKLLGWFGVKWKKIRQFFVNKKINN